MVVRQMGKVDKFVHIVVDEGLVGVTFQHIVHDHRHFSADDLAVGTEPAVRGAAGPAVYAGLRRIFAEPVVPADIGKGTGSSACGPSTGCFAVRSITR